MDESGDNNRPRRTSRQKKPSLKALESIYVSKLKSVGVVAAGSDEEVRFSEDDDEDVVAIPEKPKLLHDNEPVAGERIFTFQTPKRREGMIRKVAETLKTPHAVRDKLKSRIKAAIVEDSGSEYEASTSESSTSESGSDSSDSPVKSKKKVHLKFNDAKTQTTVKSRGRKTGTDKYTIKTDEYFSNFSSNKIKTSDNTLDRLETPRLPHYQLQKLLGDMKLSDEHTAAINRMNQTSENQFKKWLFVLHENFNILLYGLGSKRNILNSFRNEYLQNWPVIVVNGFFPTVSIKNILDGIIVELLELSENPSNPNDTCDLIEKELDTHLYLIVHNIDGETLRQPKSQAVLARLSSIPNVHLIATIDHINAPLIWDHNKLSKFNYIWWDVTSFLPYTEETSFEKSLMVQQSSSLALSSLRNVFLSLTANSKAIYLKIVLHQIENSGPYYEGMAFKDLYMLCRESFIISSDLALRAQLNEFFDHKMVKAKRSQTDGTEYLIVPLPGHILQKFIDENAPA